MTRATDEELMQAIAVGDLDAFSELVRRFQHFAWKTAYRFLGDSMEAEDIAQESFLRILEAAPRYRPTSNFCTYFYRILTNLCIDRTRKKQPATFGEMPEMPDPSRSPEGSLIEEQHEEQVRKALDALPHNQRAAMLLKHFEGLSYAEIAQILGVTSKAVERLISRARTSLQARLSDL
ncbi:MAG: sigma-70 family RNA polymerase sigma factor [Syntrophobacter sp.]